MMHLEGALLLNLVIRANMRGFIPSLFTQFVLSTYTVSMMSIIRRCIVSCLSTYTNWAAAESARMLSAYFVRPMPLPPNCYPNARCNGGTFSYSTTRGSGLITLINFMEVLKLCYRTDLLQIC